MYHIFLKHKIMVLGTFLILILMMSIILPPLNEEDIYHQSMNETLDLSYLTSIAAFVCYIVIGIKGLIFLVSKKGKKQFILRWEAIPYAAVFTSLIISGFVSAHNYNNPDSYNLLIKNLAIAILMMSLVSAIISEWNIPSKIGIHLLAPLLLLGILSSIVWHIMSLESHIDIRFYALSQFLLIGIMLILSLLFATHYLHKRFLVIGLILLGFAKISELLDKFIYNLSSNVISGHAIDNILMSAAMASILFYLETRKTTLTKL